MARSAWRYNNRFEDTVVAAVLVAMETEPLGQGFGSGSNVHIGTGQVGLKEVVVEVLVGVVTAILRGQSIGELSGRHHKDLAGPKRVHIGRGGRVGSESDIGSGTGESRISGHVGDAKRMGVSTANEGVLRQHERCSGSKVVTNEDQDVVVVRSGLHGIGRYHEQCRRSQGRS
mgnify:CR=1 FL=1